MPGISIGPVIGRLHMLLPGWALPSYSRACLRWQLTPDAALCGAVTGRLGERYASRTQEHRRRWLTPVSLCGPDMGSRAPRGCMVRQHRWGGGWLALLDQCSSRPNKGEINATHPIRTYLRVRCGRDDRHFSAG